MSPINGQSTTRRIGRVMMIATWVALFALLTFLFNNWLESKRNPNRHLAYSSGEGSAEVVLQRNRGGQYLSGGAINGQPVEFLVDTGASDVSIPEAVALRLGLKRGQARRYQTANGPITAYRTHLKRIQIGGVAIDKVDASINPHMGGETILLGMSFLRHLEFTQRGSSLILKPLSQ